MRLFLIIAVFLLVSASAYGKAAIKVDASDPDAIPDVVVTQGNNDIAQAWLIAPTTRYPHYVRGQQYEAGGLRVQLQGGDIVTLMLDAGHVFEDRTPRLADLDGDGYDEIVLVLTSLQYGAALAAYSLEGRELVLKAQTPFIGRAFRWLNPAGIADYTGDGQLDIALVQKPHLTKRLELWTMRNGRLVRLSSVDDVSNHHNGSSITRMAASEDFNGDGITDLAIPSGNYGAIRVFGFANGPAYEFMNIALPAEAAGTFSLTRESGGWQLHVPLGNMEIYRINLFP